MYDELARGVEQFLHRKGRRLGERCSHEWLELFTDDAHYWMGCRSTRYPKSSKVVAILDPGARRHVLRRVDGALKIARRKLTLDQDVLSARNVSILF